jgi:putative salt-induced outer membrane protein
MYRLAVLPALLLIANTSANDQVAQTEADLVAIDPRLDVTSTPRIAPAQIPPEVRSMIDAALASGNDGEVTTVVKYAVKAAPDYGQEIRALANKWRADREQQRVAHIRGAGAFDLWDGRGEIGGFLTTGNTENVGLSAKIDLKREGLQWRHRVFANADYQESLGLVSRERYAVGYEPNYKFDDRLYAYGALLYESDRFLGYFDRYSASAGVGYGVIRESDMSLDITIGPAFRRTNYTDEMLENSVGGRGSMDFDWNITRGLKFTQDAQAYVHTVNSTISATSGIEARLLGPLSARLSYNLQYESEPAAGRTSVDTISRAALVYDF